jgi:ubiquinone/menaquinone biosynthesis C-methylase UbiE
MSELSSWSEVFDSTYLHFYGERIGPEQTARDVELLWRLLELKPGMEVLDLACGHGRISNALAERGCNVLGLDASELFLSMARKDANARGVRSTFVHGSMEELPWRTSFGCVLSWFSAYGYLGDEADRRVLHEARRTLLPGGRMLIEQVHRDYLLSAFRRELVIERGDSFMIDRNEYEPLTGRVVTERTVVAEGRVRRIRFAVRLFGFPELRDWLVAAGFSRVEAFDGQGSALTLHSPRMIVVAHADR